MQISAISPNSFGHNEIDNEREMRYPVARAKDFDVDRVDFHAIADAVNKDKPEDRAGSPGRFCLTTLLLGIASYAATKKVSQVALTKLEDKLSLAIPMNNLGAKISRGLQRMKGAKVAKVTSVKSFFTSNGNKALKWLGTTIETVGKKGVTEQEVDAFRKAMGKNVPLSALYAKNAVKKATAGFLGVGTAAATVATRYKDADGNGIPDKAEKPLSKFNEAKELLSNVAAACELAAA